jgi:RNA polymerase sigma factor (sigma-70 family)
LIILKSKCSLSNDENYLWKLLLEGNIGALEQVMKLYFSTLFTYGSKFSTDRELVKDSIQELFVVVWERRDHLSTTVNLKAYLFSSLRRLILKKRSSGSYAVLPFNEGDVSGFDFELSIENSLIELEQTKFKAQKIRQIITNLPNRQQEIIYLKFFQNLGRDEIAEILHIHPQTVSNHLQVALKSMRSHKELVALIVLLFIYIFQV